MNIFLDTSSLFKLYHKEPGTEIIDDVFATSIIGHVFLSEITKIEYVSAVWKKVRIREISASEAETKVTRFKSDYTKYVFLGLDDAIVNRALDMMAKYGKSGLRALDSVQLASAVSLSDKCGLFITTDKLLNDFFALESLPVINI